MPNGLQRKNMHDPNITKHIPVDDGGNSLSPLDSNYAKNYISNRTQESLCLVIQAPQIENAWRRSSEYLLV